MMSKSTIFPSLIAVMVLGAVAFFGVRTCERSARIHTDPIYVIAVMSGSIEVGFSVDERYYESTRMVREWQIRHRTKIQYGDLLKVKYEKGHPENALVVLNSYWELNVP